MQQLIVIISLIAAVAYAGYRLYKALTSKGGRCYGCPLIDVCKKNKGKNREKCTKESKRR